MTLTRPSPGLTWATVRSVIAAVAVVPHPPLLFRELTGRVDVAADLRAVCLAALASVTGAGPDVVVVVGGGEQTRRWDPSLGEAVRRFGTTGPRPAAPGLPLSLGVATRLLHGAGWRGAVELHAIAWDASGEEVSALAGRLAARRDRVGLVALGDGSTRRGVEAPGYLDERALGFDAATGRALAEGDTATLMHRDADLAGELMAGCRASFAVMATAVHAEGSAPRAKVLYQDDPWGVMYHVATWDLA